MKVMTIAAMLAVALSASLVIAGQIGLMSGKMPERLGVTDGKLQPPSLTPNSVSSQAVLYPEPRQRE